MTQELIAPAEGEIIDVETNLDLSLATSLSIYVKKPSGKKVT